MSDTFNMAQYEAIANYLETGVGRLAQKKAELIPTAQREGDKWYIPQKIADALMWIAQRLEELGQWVIDKIKDALTAVAAPITLALRANDWIDRVKVPASTVQGLTDWKALRAPLYWDGKASDSYVGAVRGQSPAAGRIAGVADQVSLSCIICAGAGAAFYVALGLTLTKVILATIAAIGALMTGLGAPVAAGIFVEEAAVDSAMIWTAIGALTVMLGTQAEELLRITSEARDNADFPGGKWPRGTV